MATAMIVGWISRLLSLTEIGDCSRSRLTRDGTRDNAGPGNGQWLEGRPECLKEAPACLLDGFLKRYGHA